MIVILRLSRHLRPHPALEQNSNTTPITKSYNLPCTDTDLYSSTRLYLQSQNWHQNSREFRRRRRTASVARVLVLTTGETHRGARIIRGLYVERVPEAEKPEFILQPPGGGTFQWWSASDVGHSSGATEISSIDCRRINRHIVQRMKLVLG